MNAYFEITYTWDGRPQRCLIEDYREAKKCFTRLSKIPTVKNLTTRFIDTLTPEEYELETLRKENRKLRKQIEYAQKIMDGFCLRQRSTSFVY